MVQLIAQRETAPTQTPHRTPVRGSLGSGLHGQNSSSPFSDFRFIYVPSLSDFVSKHDWVPSASSSGGSTLDA